AVALVIERSMSEIGGASRTAADELARVNAQMENLQAQTGSWLVRRGQEISAFLRDLVVLGPSAFNPATFAAASALRGSQMSLLMEQRELEQIQAAARQMADEIYGSTLRKAQEEFVKGDLQARE